jgi:hypothetical protein
MLTFTGREVWTAILLKISGTAIAVLSWLAVIVGTCIVYPWYRVAPPAGTTDLSSFPRTGGAPVQRVDPRARNSTGSMIVSPL